jgi:alkylation response protein AidB-like acyl-CoA dehydrogenase
MSTTLERIRALGPTIRASADEIESGRRLPAPLVRQLAATGAFRLCVPGAIGGVEADVATLVEVIEETARADGSAGWCVMIGATSGAVSAYLPLNAAREIYGDADGISGGVFAPMGRATVDGDEYVVSGRWPFASGSQHCSWLMGGCLVLEGEKPRLLPSGAPEARMVLFPAERAEIVDTWTVSGLRGTGSHDIEVRDLRVPLERSVSLVTDPPRHGGTLYTFPIFGLLALGIAGVALGVARRAIEELVDLAGGKTPAGSKRRLADRAVVQMQVAQAEAAVRSARAFLFEAIGRSWQRSRDSGAVAPADRAELRLAATHATESCARAVDLMYTAGGGTSIYAVSPLQRCFRDIHVVTQHMMVAQPTYELVGRVLLGAAADLSQL